MGFSRKDSLLVAEASNFSAVLAANPAVYNETAGTAKRSTEASRSGPYRQGLVFRCNLDGSAVETLAWNFRNNYEVNVDSFGTIWQSDNDDDGNQGVRINYVMEFGNYGYSDEVTGGAWQTKRPNIEADIPSRHWHQNDPGVVPNVLITGAGGGVADGQDVGERADAGQELALEQGHPAGRVPFRVQHGRQVMDRHHRRQPGP